MKRKTDFIMQNVAGKWLLVPIGGQVMDLNGIITLNETGAFIWELLAQERTAGELSEAVAEEFNVAATVARADVQTFLDEIDQIGLVEG